MSSQALILSITFADVAVPVSCEELTQQVIVWWPCLVFHSWEIMSAKGEGG